MIIALPDYTTLRYWANYLVGIAFEGLLPQLDDEEKWEEWGARIAGDIIMQKYQIPSPVIYINDIRQNPFNTWQDWARVVYDCITRFNNRL